MMTDFIVLGVGMVLCSVLPAQSDLIMYNTKTRKIGLEVIDQPALFGPSLPMDGLRGLLVYSKPANACSPVEPPPVSYNNFFGKWILLIMRDLCPFEQKVRNAQAAGYNAVIVHNVNSSSLEPMNADNGTGITIPSVFIGSDDGAQLRESYLYTSGYYACITHDLPFDITINMLLIFSILVGICFMGMVIFIVVKFCKDRRRAMRRMLPKRSLQEITVHKFRVNDPFESCAICLEEYVEGEKLRVLPCMHAYHMKCIDPWLTDNKRVCPVCKRKVIVGNSTDTDSDSDSDDEHSSLLRGNAGPSSSQSTFERARRHFLDFVTNVSTSTSPNSSVSSGSINRQADEEDSDSFHSVTVDVQGNADTRSLLDEPSVNA